MTKETMLRRTSSPDTASMVKRLGSVYVNIGWPEARQCGDVQNFARDRSEMAMQMVRDVEEASGPLGLAVLLPALPQSEPSERSTVVLDERCHSWCTRSSSICLHSFSKLAAMIGSDEMIKPASECGCDSLTSPQRSHLASNTSHPAPSRAAATRTALFVSDDDSVDVLDPYYR